MHSNLIVPACRSPDCARWSSLQGSCEVVAKHGLCCSLYIDRGSHYFFTPRGRRHGVEDGGDAGTGFEPAWHRPYSGLLTAGSGLVLPHANIEAMNLHLQQISSQVSQGAFAVLTLDGAGWHRIGKRLVLPDNVGLLHLPPYSPELNPVENIWEFLRQNELSKSRLRDIRGYRRCLLRRLEQTHRRTRADPIHRHARLCQNGRHMSRLVLFFQEPVQTTGTTAFHRPPKGARQKRSPAPSAAAIHADSNRVRQQQPGEGCGRPYWASASSTASRQKSTSIVIDSRHRLNQSTTAAR
jgi:hypothetical protein